MKETVLNATQLMDMHSQILGELGNLSGQVLVVGDIGLDEYLLGQVSRISREAPIPGVRCRESRETLGFGG